MLDVDSDRTELNEVCLGREIELSFEPADQEGRRLDSKGNLVRLRQEVTIPGHEYVCATGESKIEKLLIVGVTVLVSRTTLNASGFSPISRLPTRPLR